MNIAICDDNPVFVDHLHDAIMNHCALKDWACNCTFFRNPKDLLDAEFSHIQVLFLDIDMPEINGLTVARKLRKQHPDLLIVFVTGFIEYAPAGYDVDAFRYLLKSELRYRLPKCLNDMWERLYVTNESIRIQLLDSVIMVRIKDILYIEGTPQRHVLLHAVTSPTTALECIGSLASFETMLQNKGFLRIQRSFLTNMWHISDIRGYYALLDNGEKLRVSRSNYTRICEHFILWEGQHL